MEMSIFIHSYRHAKETLRSRHMFIKLIMGRIMAIDYGSKRCGLAVTDSLRILATGLDSVHSKDIIVYLEKYSRYQ